MHTWPPRQPDRNALEIWLFIWVAVGSFAIAWGYAPLPFSLSETPYSFGQGSILLIWFGAVIGGLGLAWKNRYIGLRLEQFGMLLFGLGAGMWATAIGFFVGWTWDSPGAVSMSMSYGLALGCGFRFWQIGRYLDRRRAFEREMQAVEPIHVGVHVDHQAVADHEQAVADHDQAIANHQEDSQ